MEINNFILAGNLRTSKALPAFLEAVLVLFSQHVQNFGDT